MSVTLPIVRASSMPLACSCPASINGDGVQVDSFDPTATDGVEVHRAIAMALRGEEYPPFDGINAGENEDMVALALAYAKREGLDSCETELHIEAPPFAATLDLYGPWTNDDADVVDWKTTHREDDHEAQIIAQCACVFARYPERKVIIAHTVYLRNEGAIKKRYTRAWVKQWADEFIRNTLQHPEIYRPGEWCGRCKRKFSCEALRAQRREIAEMILGAGAGMLTRDNVPEIRTKAKMLRDILDIMDGMIRTEVLEHGPIPMGDGKELRALDVNTDRINLRRSWEILTAKFTDEELSAFLQVHKTPMVKMIEAAAPRGQKSKASAAFMETLKAAGAVTTETSQQVRVLNVRE